MSISFLRKKLFRFFVPICRLPSFSVSSKSLDSNRFWLSPKSNRQLSITFFNISTVVFSQHSFIFRRNARRNKFSKLSLAFSEIPYTRHPVRFCNFSTLRIVTSYCGVVHNFSTAFRHVFNNFFSDRTVARFHGRIGSGGRTSLFRSVHNGLNDRYFAQERHVVLLG